MWRKEISYTASVNLTKVHGPARNPHRLRLRPPDARSLAAGGRQPARHAVVRRRHHRHAGLHRDGSAAGTATRRSCSGLMSGYGKSVQFEEMTGRENQLGFYLTDRWQVNEKADREPRPALRVLPVDVARRPRPRAARLQHVHDQARWPGRQSRRTSAIKVDKALFAPRLGLAYRINREHGVPRRLREDVQPAALVASDARLLSGDDRLQRCRPERLHRRTAPSPPASLARPIRTSRAATSRCRAASPCARPIRTTSSAATPTRGTCSSSAGCRAT